MTSPNSPPSTVVVVEDDPAISDLVALYLRRDGHTVVQAADGELALQVLDTHRPNVLVLDVGLPGIDGLEVCRRVRARNDSVAVIFLTARDDEVDRVLGLELGADDYVTKPFSPRELAARVKAILRRAGRSGGGGADADPAGVVRAGAVEVDLGRHETRVGGEPVPLAAQEFELLACFARNRGLALSRRQLLDGAWGEDWVGDERTVDVHVRQLRRKLGPGVTLSTVRGVGYRLD